MLLHFGDKFNKVDALSEIAKTVEDREVVGAAINLKFEEKVKKIPKIDLNFLRSENAVIEPNI